MNKGMKSLKNDFFSRRMDSPISYVYVDTYYFVFLIIISKMKSLIDDLDVKKKEA